MEKKDFFDGRKNSPGKSWTEFFQNWMMKNPKFTFTLILTYSAIAAFLFFGSDATNLASYLSILAGIAVTILLATKGKK